MKLVSIVGPTGAGKTAFALQMAHQFLNDGAGKAEVHLVSVDSRQIYQGLEIVSGADIPPGFELTTERFSFPCFQRGNLYVHGVSCIAPNQTWSVAHFQQFAWELLTSLEQQSPSAGLVIFVGGTGLYHASLTQFDEQLHIGPDEELRAQWEQADLTALQLEVQRLSSTTFDNLTESDQRNPRRLVRQIEILSSKVQQRSIQETRLVTPPQAVRQLVNSGGIETLGLTAEREVLRANIKTRVEERLESGAIDEVRELLQMSAVSPQLLSATGVAEIREFLSGITNRDELLEKWVVREYRYAKRQLTWWRHKENINWLSPNGSSLY